MKNIDLIISWNIKKKLLESNKTIKGLALCLNIPYCKIYRKLSGNVMFTYSEILSTCEYLKCSMKELFVDSDDIVTEAQSILNYFKQSMSNRSFGKTKLIIELTSIIADLQNTYEENK